VEGRSGRPPLDPRLLICLWIYAYSEKVSSAREVARRCGYQSGLSVAERVRGDQPSHPVGLSVDHQQAWDGLFAQLLAILSKRGLITLEQVVHDGTKGKRRPSGKSFHREKDLAGASGSGAATGRGDGGSADEPRQGARSAPASGRRARRWHAWNRPLEELKKVQAAPEGGRRNRAARQPDRSRSAGDETRRRRLRSQSQRADLHRYRALDHRGDERHQEPSDQQQLVPAVEEVERQNGRAPGQMIVDEGYSTRENVLAAEERGLT